MASPAPSNGSTGDSQFDNEPEGELWEVIEITAERPKLYRVKWKGNNPVTGRPWPQDWIPKKDVTDDLKDVWKEKKKEKEKQRKVPRKTTSSATGKSRESTTSNSTVMGDRDRTRSHSGTATVSTSRQPASGSTTALTLSVKKFKTSKRKRQSEDAIYDITTPTPNIPSDHEPELAQKPQAGPSRKRQKVHVGITRRDPTSSPVYQKNDELTETQESYEVKPKKKYGKALPKDNDFDIFDEEVRGAARVMKVKDRMKPRSSGKGKEKARDNVDLLVNDVELVSMPPPTKIGPPRGVKQNLSSTSIQRKSSTSNPSSDSLSVSKLDVVGALKKNEKPKPSPGRFRSSSATHRGVKESSPKRLSDKRAFNNDYNDNYNMDPGYADEDAPTQEDLVTDSPEQHYDEDDDQFSLPSPDDGYDLENNQLDANVLPESSPLPIPESDEAPPEFDQVPPLPKLDTPPGGYGFSPDVPATQSQDSAPLSPGQNSFPHNAEPITPVPSFDPEVEQMPPIDHHANKTLSSKHANIPNKPVPNIDLRQQSHLSKPLHPVPQLSPSAFRPHLPSKHGGLEDDEIEPDFPSTIEEFTSPDKQKSRESIKTFGSTQRSRNSFIDDDDSLRVRGQELADIQYREREQERKQTRKDKARRSLSAVIKSSSRGPESEPDIGPLDDSFTVQEMEDRYVDLDGGVDSEPVKPSPQEEEESTQDLEQERALWMKPANGEGEGSSVQERAAEGWGRVDEEMDIELSNIETPAQPAIVEQTIAKAKPATKSRSKSKSAPPVQDDRMDEELPPTLSPPHFSTLKELSLTRSQTEPLQRPKHNLDNALRLLNVKSEEISKLRASMDSERQRNRELVFMNQHLEADASTAKSALSKTNLDTIVLAETQEKWEHERTLWGSERTALVTSVEALTRSKASAETDRDFFREQYAQASGFVGSVREENADLERRALVAEGQAKDGVAMFKATYEGKIKLLQGEIAQLKGISEILQEKDRRTTDEIRKKAAQEPELRMQNASLMREIERLEDVIDELSRDRKVLKSKLGEAMSTVGSQMTAMMSGSDPSYGDDLLYRCLWRPGDTAPCLNTFDSPEALELHMFTDEHMVVQPGDTMNALD